MKGRIVLFMVVLTLGMLLVKSIPVLADTNVPDDGATGRTALMREVRTLFEQERFAELEDMARKLRSEKTCFRDGWPKLDSFYAAFTFDNRIGCEIKSEPAYETTLQLMDKWSVRFPASVTRRVAEGGVWIDYAWFARGSGYANTVTKEGWELFGKRIWKAYELLDKAPESKADDCPKRYAFLLIIGRAQGWDREKYDALFNQAIAFDPTYYPFYCEKTINLLPRWGGEEGEWQRFAEDAVKLTPQSEGMTAYTRVLRTTWKQGEWKNFQEAGVSWPKMRQGFMDMEKNHPGSDMNLNSFALFAFLANDKQTAVKLFDRIGDKPCLEVWNSRAYYEKYRRIAGSDKKFQVPISRSTVRKLLFQKMGAAYYLFGVVFGAEPGFGYLADVGYYLYALRY